MMTTSTRRILLLALVATAILPATNVMLAVAQSAPAVSPAKPVKQRIPNYIDPSLLDLSLILPPPPAQDSATTKAELAEIHRIEQSRTPEQVAAAQYDDHHEDIFLFSKLMAPNYNPAALPLTADLSAKVRSDASLIDNPLKQHFVRPRPYNFDTSLHPVCDTNQDFSYPSGHSLNGYLFAFTLIQLVPEKRDEILARADEYAHNRVVCEAHYPSDLEASRRVAYSVVAAMLASPRFQRDLTAARIELRQNLTPQTVHASVSNHPVVSSPVSSK